MANINELTQRQVLVNLGNRYVVFGPTPGLPHKLQFDADRDSELLPRVADESEIAAERVVQTLRVHNMTRSATHDKNDPDADVVLTDSEGRRVFVEVKVRDHDPKTKDLTSAFERIRAAEATGKNLEIWHLNIERLNLVVQAYAKSMPQSYELPPADVWEKTQEGVFRRDQVVHAVDDWERRVDALYGQIQNWLGDRPDIHFDRSRTVTMSEDLMQKFAVSEKQLPVLDVLSNDQVAASFVPRGLWLIGAWGRIDVITQSQTRILVATKDNSGAYEWCLVSTENRLKTSPLTKNGLISIVIGS